MGDRKAPNPPPSERPASDPVSRQIKPTPPPAPPMKRYAVDELHAHADRELFNALAAAPGARK